MKEKIKIIYIDDAPDFGLSEYLSEYKQDDYEFESIDIHFESNKGYEGLIRDPKVTSANIIFIDSKLFENRKASDGKFTGEEFKVILKKLFPFIEVIVITQNEVQPGYETIKKYSHQQNINVKEYYGEIIPNKIEDAIRRICESRKIMSTIQNNNRWEKLLVEKIYNSLNGLNTYDELSKEDIDNIINIFKKIHEMVISHE